MTQPESMKTKAYVYGVEKINGFDAWALFKACAAGDLQRAKTLLSKDRRLVNAQFWYQFPIHMAVRAGDRAIVKLLLDHGADPGLSRFTYNSWDKLLQIASEREYRHIESLLVRAMKAKFSYSPDFQSLKNAIISRDSRSVNAVLRRRPELAIASDALGNNPLHWSVITRQLGLVKRFVSLGTPVNAPRADGQTPILLTLSQGHDYWYRGARGRSHPSIRNVWVITGDLLARGANYTLSVAAAVGDQERVERLLKKDTGLAKQLDSARVSPLSHAAREGHTHIVRLLLEHGAVPNMPENLAPHGRALFEACGGNHLETAELLLKYGADPNAGVDSCGCCLTIVEHHHGRTARKLQLLLRRCGAHVPPYAMSTQEMTRAIRDGNDVIHDEEFLGRVMGKCNRKLFDLYLNSVPSVPHRMQVYAGITYPKSPSMVRQLLDHGLDPNRPDWNGRTFLHACAANGDRSVAAAFLEAGADINARDVEFKETPLATAIRCAQPPEEEDARLKQAEQTRRMVKFLLKNGAATKLPDDEPWATPLAWARKRKLRDIEFLLLDHGAQT